MEIRTTIRDLPDKIRHLKFDPETQIRLIIKETRPQITREKSHFPFLHSETWSDENGPTDVSQNIDHYLYDTENIHGDQIFS